MNIFNYADYVKLHGECVKLKAENEKLKCMIKAMVDDIRQCPICVRCKYWDATKNDYSEECRNCGWYPWNDEDTVPCIWKWREHT